MDELSELVDQVTAVKIVALWLIMYLQLHLKCTLFPVGVAVQDRDKHLFVLMQNGCMVT